MKKRIIKTLVSAGLCFALMSQADLAEWTFTGDVFTNKLDSEGNFVYDADGNAVLHAAADVKIDVVILAVIKLCRGVGGEDRTFDFRYQFFKIRFGKRVGIYDPVVLFFPFRGEMPD